MNLNNAATSAKNSLRSKEQAEIDKRAKNGTPQSEDTNYEAVKEHLAAAIAATGKGQDSEIEDAIAKARDEIGTFTTLSPEFVPIPDTGDLEICIELLGRAEYQDLLAAAFGGLATGDTAPLKILFNRCVQIRGFEFEQGGAEDETSNALLWEHAGIDGVVFLVLRHFNEVSFSEKKRFGSQMGST